MVIYIMEFGKMIKKNDQEECFIIIKIYMKEIG